MKKNRFLVVVLILALFIPSYIGVYSYIHTNKKPVTPDTATGVTISDIVGKSYTAAADSDIAKLLNRIISSSTPLSEPPAALSGSDYFKVTFTEGKRSTEYRYFFSQNTDAVYFLDAAGKSYLVSETDAAEFLQTPYAQCLYAEAYLPEMKNGDNVILPTSYNWAYQTAGAKNILASTLAETATDTVSYTSKSGLSFDFGDRTPASFTVTLTADGNVLYSGDYASIGGAVDVKKYSALTVEAAVEWKGNEEHMSSGSATYKFVLNIEAQTEFFLGADSVQPGGIIPISAYNVADASKITFAAEPALTHGGKTIAPKFYADGKNAYAILPTTYETVPGTYTFTFTYDGMSFPFTFTVTEKTFKKQAYDIAKATAEATRNAKTLAAYDKLVAEIAAGDFGTKYFDGVWNTGIAEEGYNGTIMTGYGLYRSISKTGEVYRHDGVDFYAKDGSKVLAVNAGKVVYVGVSDYPGVFVVIDHGYGLLSWYGNLAKATVKTGDVVAAGDAIATSGSTGFTKGNSLHVGLTVFGVPVCPYDLWENPITFR